MPTCVKCGYWDETDAEFDSTRTICEGCMEQPKPRELDPVEPDWEEDDYGNFRPVFK
ncbi:hypothetical protein [Paenibacillus qinlingensis]|uniref:Uncharacterized protein n=1 Tax=Paenibacillus qinlingensis TaxID=1837343 RepID=A0ABU1P6W3_9BACL|nr:hypothetical protein [Paenibacillus qinlingensis]MDR6555476.1 hypothetical protein [Paenibacillus qinlingensis]